METTDPEGQPVLAKRARINPRSGVFEIDGRPFPYWLATDASVEFGANDATVLVLRVPLEHGVTIDDELTAGEFEATP